MPDLRQHLIDEHGFDPEHDLADRELLANPVWVAELHDADHKANQLVVPHTHS